MRSEVEKKIESIIRNIRLIRENRNYTQEYMAMRMHCSQNAYSKLELGNSKLTVERLMQVADVLEVSIGELVSPEKHVSYSLLKRR